MKKIPENISKILSEFITVIKDTFGDRVRKIILYGSYARGDYREDSDIDVAVAVPRSSISKDILEDMTKLCKLRRDVSVDIEPVLIIDEEDPSGFLESISEYGEVVYSS